MVKQHYLIVAGGKIDFFVICDLCQRLYHKMKLLFSVVCLALASGQFTYEKICPYSWENVFPVHSVIGKKAMMILNEDMIEPHEIYFWNQELIKEYHVSESWIPEYNGRFVFHSTNTTWGWHDTNTDCTLLKINRIETHHMHFTVHYNNMICEFWQFNEGPVQFLVIPHDKNSM